MTTFGTMPVMPTSRRAPWRVFLSYTSELGDPWNGSFVEAAVSAVNEAVDAPDFMKNFVAQSVAPARVCRDAVDTADVFVLVAGFRYGSLVTDRPNISYCELEYQTARDAGLTCLVFILTDPAGGRPDNSSSARYDSRQEDFVNWLKNEPLVVKTVSSPSDLKHELLRALEYEHGKVAARNPAEDPVLRRDAALLTLVNSLTAADLLPDAQRVAKGITSVDSRTDGLIVVAMAWVKARRVDEAQRLAASITDAAVQGKVRSAVVQPLISQGRLQAAEQMAQAITDADGGRRR